MKYVSFLFIIFVLSLHAKVIPIAQNNNYIEILSQSEIYLDHSKSLTINDIFDEKVKFKPNKESLLGYGYSPNFDVWVKFTLKNNSNQIINKILEYENPMTSKVIFFENNTIKKIDGTEFIDLNRTTINPYIEISLKPFEEQIYYIKSSSSIATLIVKLNLWNENSYFQKEIKYQIILALFFGAMLIMGFYNLFIFFFTKDISYFYYVIYVFGVIFHQSMYVGIINIYFLPQEAINFIMHYASIVVAIPIYALALFTKTFLQTKQYKVVNYIFNVLLALIPLTALFFIIFDSYKEYRNLFNMILGFYLLLITIYATYKKNKQAYFILSGWLIVVSAAMVMYLSSAGIFSIYNYFPYITEVAFVLEALIFSIALANRINVLSKKLQAKVYDQNIDIQASLTEKQTLLKELNHRVKNNLQTMLSLIRMQIDETNSIQCKDQLMTIQNRINAMNYLHELLYTESNTAYVDTNQYISMISDQLFESNDIPVDIFIDVSTDFRSTDAIYCGLIINELLTNSFKYAFKNDDGEINIILYKKKFLYHLIVEDNGIGFDSQQIKNSLGLSLIENLVTIQLNGTIDIQSRNGTKAIIQWK